MSYKIKINAVVLIILICIFILFSAFYKIKTYTNALLVQFNKTQVIQVNKSDQINFEVDQNIKLLVDDRLENFKIISIEDTNAYLLLSLDKYIKPSSKNFSNIFIYNKATSLGNYLLDNFFK